MSESSESVGEEAKEAKGKVQEKIGWATGDREAEAKGQVEQEQVGARDETPGEDRVESVDEAEDRVRRGYQEKD